MRRTLILFAALTVASCSGSSTAPSPSTPTPPNVTVTPLPTQPAPAPVVRGPQFSQTFWDEFVHNGFEQPGALASLQRLTAAPMLYLKTVDEAGQPIDNVTLQTVEDAMRGVALTWSGGQYGLTGVQRGTATMEGQYGWLTVKWPNPSIGAICGRSTIGADGGFLQLNYLNPNCSCGSASRIYPRLARHELGHGFGYWHTDSGSDVMYGQAITGALDCNLSPSARETYHATIAYQTPVGTTNSLHTFSSSSRIIVD